MNRLLWLGFAAFSAYAFWAVDLWPGRILPGLGRLVQISSEFVPPDAGGQFIVLVFSLIETLGIALAATVMAAVLAFPLGLLGSAKVLPNWLWRWPLRRGMDLSRSIDVLLWALLFVNAVGLGPFAGVMALMMVDLGTLAKLFSEAVDHCSPGPVEGVLAAGGNRWEVVRFGILPQVLPAFAAQALYYLESNVRHATILGVVGAGGIGMHLTDQLRVNEWQQVSVTVLLILAAVTAVDRLSRWARFELERGN